MSDLQPQPPPREEPCDDCNQWPCACPQQTPEERAELEADYQQWLYARGEKDRRIAALEATIEADRTRIIDGVNRVERALNGYFWLTEGRGSYGWDDDRYQKEFGNAARAVLKALEPLRKIGADLTNCPQTTAEVVNARADKDAKLAALEAQLAEAQERLAMAVEALEPIVAAWKTIGSWYRETSANIHETNDVRLSFEWPGWHNRVESTPSIHAKHFERLTNLVATTAASVAQHTAEVERRGAKSALEAFAERDDWTLDVPRSLVDRIRRLLTEAARAAELEAES